MTRDDRQKKCVTEWFKASCLGTLCLPTGFGKTRTAILCVQKFLKKNPDTSIAVVVPTEVLKTQWESILKQNDLRADVYIINTIVKYPIDVDIIILDECHLYAADEFQKVLTKSKYFFLLGLSATYERLDGRHQTILDKFIPVCDKVSVEEAIANRWLAPVKQYLVLIEPQDIEMYNGYHQQFNSAFAAFDFDFTTAMNCATNVNARIAFANRTKQALGIVTAQAMSFMKGLQKRRDYIYNHPRKVELANLILSHRQDKKSITFWKTIKMAEQVKYGYVLHSQQTKKKRSITMEEFSKLSSGCINSSKALTTGVDVPGLNLGIIGGLDSSKTTKTQITGRVCRFEPGKEAELFVLVLKNTQEERWFRNSNSQDYITISEHELLNLLLDKEYEVLINSKDRITDKQLRF